MRYPLRIVIVAASSALAMSACSTSDGLEPEPEPRFCLDFRGTGQTEGTIHRLRGDGTFMFGDQPRPAFVALYLFNIRDAENGGKSAHANYQFVWNGESFLTADDIFLEPVLDPETFRFNVQMTIVAATGRFNDLIGGQPVTLDASIRIGPPPEPGDPPAAREEFTVAGKLCGDQWK